MKKMKSTLVYILLALVSISCSQNKENLTTISGNIKGLENSKVILLDENYKPQDTVEATNNKFIFKKNSI